MGHHDGPERIAGLNTAADWAALRDTLRFGEPAGWDVAFRDFFLQRLGTRYLRPIEVLQQTLESEGEGFSICALQCSLLEFLEATAQGMTYRYLRKGETLGDFEYDGSKAMFTAFLRDRKPFCDFFDKDSALDFYSSVRCGLLHEARTKNGWVIRGGEASAVPVDVAGKRVYRDVFQRCIRDYIDRFGEELPKSRDLQQSFVRKFNSL